MAHEFRTKRRIEFFDVDLAGFVHFSRYFLFMETAESEFLRSLGTSIHYRKDGKEVGWPKRKVECEYFLPVRFEEELEICVRVLRKGKKSITYEFEFTRGADRVARGVVTSTCCMVDAVTGLKAVPIPKELAEQLEEAPRK